MLNNIKRWILINNKILYFSRYTTAASCFYLIIKFLFSPICLIINFLIMKKHVLLLIFTLSLAFNCMAQTPELNIGESISSRLYLYGNSTGPSSPFTFNLKQACTVQFSASEIILNGYFGLFVFLKNSNGVKINEFSFLSENTRLGRVYLPAGIYKVELSPIGEMMSYRFDPPPQYGSGAATITVSATNSSIILE